MIYEVLRIYDRRCLFLDEHLERLRNNLALLHPDYPFSTKAILEALGHFLQSQNIEQGNLMISLEPAISTIPKIIQIPHHYPTEQEQKDGVAVISIQATRDNPTVKTWNPQVRELANLLIKQHKVYEALLLNHENDVTEGSRSNLFWIKNRIIFSPPAGTALPGITRQKIIDLAGSLNLRVIEESIKIDDLARADEIFLSGTSPGVLPVKEINGIMIDSDKLITRSLQVAYHELVKKYLESNQLL